MACTGDLEQRPLYSYLEFEIFFSPVCVNTVEPSFPEIEGRQRICLGKADFGECGLQNSTI